MLVSVIGLTSLTLVRVQWRTEQTAMNAGRTRQYARSVIETAVAYSLADPNWRANYATLVSYMPMAIDQGYCSVAITELDGTALQGNADTDVLLTGTGRIGAASSPEAVSRWSVQALHPPLDLLRTALHSASWVYNYYANLEVADGPISSATTLVNTGTLQGSVEAASVNNWGYISGSVTTGAPAKTMPASNTWDYYRNQTSLVVLPASTIGSTMEWVVLSPDSNPWASGSKSSDGLYYIRPSGDLRIRNCRIVGTLLVELTSGSELELQEGLLWEPARVDYPSLLVKGDCVFSINSSLSESSRTNFNPSGTPYQGGSDSDKTDSYSSLLKGVFHTIGSGSSLTIEDNTSVKGVVIAESSVTIRDNVRLAADPDLCLTPPIKYRMPHLQLIAGTWQPIVSTTTP